MTAPRAYSKAAAAEAAGVSEQTIDRAIKAGLLRAKRTSKTADGEPAGKVVILVTALDAWLEGLVDA
ncbi:MAG: hypothetical protein JWM76_4208 [Pseudonocardiales bacterium]|nr:hypothetical protein [Pseudonocardiales bacterium]